MTTKKTTPSKTSSVAKGAAGKVVSKVAKNEKSPVKTVEKSIEKKSSEKNPEKVGSFAKATRNKTPRVPEDFTYGTGKRKTSIAKVYLFAGTGVITFNDKPAFNYLNSELLVDLVSQPLRKLGLEKKYDVLVSSFGGGIVGQAEASRLGLARALVALNEEFKSALRAEGFLTRDSRIKERKKYGRKRARKGFQYRKR